jgi:uncharacterized protein (DUF1499 family)
LRGPVSRGKMPDRLLEVAVAETFPSLNVPRWPATLTRAGLWLLVIGIALVVIAGPLNRFGITGFQPALLVLAGGALLLVLGVPVGMVGFLGALAKGTPISRAPAALAIVVSLGLLGYLLSWLQAGRGVPPIHEISTDLESPPPFVAIREIRQRIPGVNPSDYVAEQAGRSGTLDVPQQQRRAYPDIQPMQLPVPPAEAFARVERAGRALGWEIVAAVPDEGRLEATDTTRFFGFKDDVVVRLRAEGGGTRVDVRSKSRVGVGDVGANAARIRAFFAELGATS